MIVSILLDLLIIMLATIIYIIVSILAILFRTSYILDLEMKYKRVGVLFLFNYMLPFTYTGCMLIAKALTRPKILLRSAEISVIIWVITIAIAYFMQADEIKRKKKRKIS